MSAAQFDLGLRLAAHHARRLVPRTSTRRFDLRQDAMVIAVLASPGDHSGIWGLAWAPINGRPTVATAGDPRPWQAQVALWEKVGESWAGWLDSLVKDSRHAQFVVADPSAAERIVWSARKVASSEIVAPKARAAARAFIVAQHVSRTTGQQSIAAMSSLLREHYVSGHDPLDESHLGLWAGLPTLRPGWDDPQVALPPGADGTTTPLGKAWDKMTRHASRGGEREMTDLFGQNVATQVRKLVTVRWEALRAATKVYQAHPGSVLAATADQAVRDARTFTYHMVNERVPATKSPKARWITLADRELAAELWQEALWSTDALERTRGIASGDVLVGCAADGRVLTTQPVLRVRPGDDLTSDDGAKFTVRDLQSTPDGLVVVTSDPSLDGEVVAWPTASTMRQPIPEAIPWTHDATARNARMEAPAGDLLARVQELRVAV